MKIVPAIELEINAPMFVYVLPHRMKKRKNTPLDFTYMMSLEPRNLLDQKKFKKDNQVTFKKAKN